MEIRRTDGPWAKVQADWLVIPVTESQTLTGPLGELDQQLGGVISRLKEMGDLTGKLASTLPLRGVTGIGTSRILFVGLGPASELTIARLDKALMTAARAISDKVDTHVAIALPSEAIGPISLETFAT